MEKSDRELGRARLDARIRKALVATNGSVCKAAGLLHVKPAALSRMLGHHTIVRWWHTFKMKRFVGNSRARWRAAKRRATERGYEKQGLDPAIYCKWLQDDPTTRLRRPKKTPDRQ